MFNKFSKLISPNQETVLRFMNFCQSYRCNHGDGLSTHVLDFGAL
jgi:hypothetical protein